MSSNSNVDSGAAPPGPLAGLRVLELSDEKGQWCGKLMADLGADLIKIEPPGGQNTRTVGPFLDDLPHPERSLYFWHYNTSKRGITLNLETASGRELFRRLAAGADIILETFPPGYLPTLGLGYEDLSPGDPGLIFCSLTPFGQTGPWRDYISSDLTHLASGGQMASCGYDEDDVPDAPPIAPGGGNAYHMAGHYAYMGIMVALAHRHATGEGQYIDSSIHEACCLTTEAAVSNYMYAGLNVIRQTGRHAAVSPTPKFLLPTSDGGWIHTTRSRLNPARLKGLAEWMDEHGMAGDLLDERYQDPAAITAAESYITEKVDGFITSLSTEEAYHGSQARDWPWGSVRTMDDILEDGHLEDRGFFTQVEHPELGRSFTYPGPAAIYNGSPWRISRRAPLIGEHNVEIFCGELGLTRQELAVLAESRMV